jgi:hypothetical protein
MTRPQATATSGLRTLPMVAGMLSTSMGSGVLVGRTGRYKIFPVAGTAVMAVAFLLMSTMSPSTSTLLQSLYLFILGAGIGLCMQVLVLIVQNTSRFEDLGVATSGVTFFRTIGSSFGAAIFGSLFTNFLHSRIGPALAASGAPAAAANSPEALHRLPRAMAAPIVGAYAASLTQVFLWAVPVALVGFAVALFLREVPLRDIGNNAADMGDGFAMPTTQSPEEMLETAIGRLLRGEPGMRLRSIAMRPDCQRDVDRLWLTASGARQVDFVATLIRDWIVDKLTRSPNFEGRPDRAQVEAALDRIAHRIVVQPDWGGDQRRLSAADREATERVPRPIPSGSGRTASL